MFVVEGVKLYGKHKELSFTDSRPRCLLKLFGLEGGITSDTMKRTWLEECKTH